MRSVLSQEPAVSPHDTATRKSDQVIPAVSNSDNDAGARPEVRDMVLDVHVVPDLHHF